jgi:hypothetical protein
LGIKKFMLAQTIASYTENNVNSNICVQGAMLVGTNETITVRMLRMTPTKRAKKGNDERERMPLSTRTVKGLKRKKF